MNKLRCFFLMTLITSSLYGQKNPNIIFILADDLGYGDVKCFNPGGKIATPNMDELAAGGMMFTDAHSSSAVCTPSRYSILTGRYPWRSRLQKDALWGYAPHLIDPARLTVASFLKNNGYFTACVGKWHLGMDWVVNQPASKDSLHFLRPTSGNPLIKTGWEVDYSKPIENGPNSVGFDYFYGISASLDMPPFVFIENDRTVEIPAAEKTFFRPGPAGKDFEAVNVLPAVVKKTQEIIVSKAASNTPFFIYMAMPSPHTPIVPDADFKGKSGVTDYGDYVMETDWGVGQVMKTLDSLGIADDTIVFFSSDNGFAPYVLRNYKVEKLGHFPSYIFRGYKSDIWEGGHRVPTIVRWPGHIQRGSTCSQFISLTDFMATCAGLLNEKLPDNAGEDSYNIMPYLAGETKRPVRKSIVYASMYGNFSIQEGKWKLELCPNSGGYASPKEWRAYREGSPLIQLYDMESDVSEKRNVEAQFPEVAKRMTKLLETIIKNGRSTPGRKLKNDVPVDLWKKGW